MFENPYLVKSSLASGISGKRILVVGDLMLDKYIAGSVGRISPEAPVPVVKVERRFDRLGGAANLAANFSHLGFTVDLAGFLGDDADADIFTTLCAGENVGKGAIQKWSGYPTITKTRILGEHQQIVRLDDEDPAKIDHAASDLLVGAIRARMADFGYDAIVLSDYAKGVCREGVCQEVIGLAKSQGIPVFVDPKGFDYEKYRGASVVKPNRAEISEVAKRHGWPADNPVGAAVSLRDWLGLTAVVLTLGGQGISVVRNDGVVSGAALAREVFDVSGAGDTVMAMLVAGSLFNLSDPDLVALCNLAAAQVVGKIGSTPVDLSELMLEVRRVTAPGGQEKLHDGPELAEVVRTWRSQGLHIGFTNGCFDLLHAGHIRLFEAAAAACDRLIVAINSDESIRRIKGESRPFMHEADRISVLCALHAVDAVAVFEEDTPEALIRSILPDLLVKGSDYEDAEVVGADIVQARGGKVLLVPILEGLSTSRYLTALQKL
jgi:D-beta-D-heptose 7-phosphate kinase/D-beta-D-heptose 1-phosphate adenosyltransferase